MSHTVSLWLQFNVSRVTLMSPRRGQKHVLFILKSSLKYPFAGPFAILRLPMRPPLVREMNGSVPIHIRVVPRRGNERKT